MLALAVPAGFLRRASWVPGAYLVPRDDGRLLVGATVEDAGFDVRVTASASMRCSTRALPLRPRLAAFTVTETWAGLRPESPTGGRLSVRPASTANPRSRPLPQRHPARAGNRRLVAEFVESGDAAPLHAFVAACRMAGECGPNHPCVKATINGEPCDLPSGTTVAACSNGWA